MADPEIFSKGTGAAYQLRCRLSQMHAVNYTRFLREESDLLKKSQVNRERPPPPHFNPPLPVLFLSLKNLREMSSEIARLFQRRFYRLKNLGGECTALSARVSVIRFASCEVHVRGSRDIRKKASQRTEVPP